MKVTFEKANNESIYENLGSLKKRITKAFAVLPERDEPEAEQDLIPRWFKQTPTPPTRLRKKNRAPGTPCPPHESSLPPPIVESSRVEQPA